jgi:hypothetical protein
MKMGDEINEAIATNINTTINENWQKAFLHIELDDSGLKNYQYYPYDLVHYEG